MIFSSRQFFAERAGQAEIETGIIDQHDGIDSLLANVAERGRKLPPEIAVFFQHFPKPEDGGVPAPIEPCLRPRPRASAARPGR